MDKTGFTFARKERELKCDLTEEEWGWVALQEHGGAKGEAEERSEAMGRLVESVPGVGAVGETGEAPSEPTTAA